MAYKHQAFPSWRYGPNGAAVIVNSEDETPKGFSAERDKGSAAEGTKTAVVPPNSTVSVDKAAKTTTAPSQTITPPEIAAKTDPLGTSGATSTPAAEEIDAHGHAYDPALHAATKSKTKDDLWRMKVGVARPDPAPGFPKPPLDL